MYLLMHWIIALLDASVLAKKNQDIAAVLRQIDDIPTRAELIQYERRFVELYSLVFWINVKLTLWHRNYIGRLS